MSDPHLHGFAVNILDVVQGCREGLRRDMKNESLFCIRWGNFYYRFIIYSYWRKEPFGGKKFKSLIDNKRGFIWKNLNNT